MSGYRHTVEMTREQRDVLMALYTPPSSRYPRVFEAWIRCGARTEAAARALVAAFDAAAGVDPQERIAAAVAKR